MNRIKTEPVPTVIHDTDLELLVGISTRQLRIWAEAGHFAAPRRSIWSLRDTVQGIISYYKHKGDHDKKLMDSEVLELKRQQRIKIQMENEEQKGILVNRTLLQPAQERAIKEVCAKIEAVPELTELQKERILKACADIWHAVALELGKPK